MKKLFVIGMLAAAVAIGSMACTSSKETPAGNAETGAAADSADATGSGDAANATGTGSTGDAANATDANGTGDTAATGSNEAGGAAATEGGSISEATLPVYVYPGDDAIMEATSRYMVEELAANYPEGDVAIPSILVVAKDESDENDVKVWGDYWIYLYDLNGDTLENAAGGNYPGLMHLKKTDDGYTVTEMDMVADGSDWEPSAKKIFGEYYEDLIKAQSNMEEREKVRGQWIKDYVDANGLAITQYKDYGWDPVKLSE